MRPRTLLAALALLAPLLALPALAATATPEQLAADVDKGITIWSGWVTLYKKGNGPHNTIHNIIVGSDDLREIRSWPGNSVYVVVYVAAIDAYGTIPPKLQVIIQTLEGSWVGGTIYVTSFVTVNGPGTYTFVIPKDIFDNPSLEAGFRVTLHINEWWDTANGQDSYYAITVRRVVIAPPKGAEPTHTLPATSTTPMSASLDLGSVDKWKAAAIGCGVIAFILAILLFAGRGRRRLFALVPLALVALGTLAPAATAAVNIDLSSYIKRIVIVPIPEGGYEVNETITDYGGVEINGTIIKLSDPNPRDSYIPAIDLALPFDAMIRVVNGTVKVGDPDIAMVSTNGTIIVRGGNTVIVDEILSLSASRIIIASQNATLAVTPLSYEDVELSGENAKEQVYTDMTPPTKKYIIHFTAGTKVHILIKEGAGSHDVYVFFPGHKYWKQAANKISDQWNDFYWLCWYDSGKCHYQWYPKKSSSFTAPTEGDYLFVVVKYKKNGYFKLKITWDGGKPSGSPGTYTPNKPSSSGSSKSGATKTPWYKSKNVKYTIAGAVALVLILAVVSLTAGHRRRR